MGRFDNWEPAQETREYETVDLRHAALGPKGYKVNPIKSSRKRKMGEQPEDQPQAMDRDDGGAEAAAAAAAAAEPPPAAKRQRVEGEPYRTVSGKVWKGAGFKAGTYKSAIMGTSWEKKMATKAAKKQFSEQKAVAVDSLRAKRKAKRDERTAAATRKKENQAKSAVVQKVTNSATVKKMMKSKKQRKLLKTADTN
ncbi:hypothetical protein Rsub_00546 [Raphidocelis subcapitata]|uniref:Coiled-coil domain-containing protein 86 n=1 Tax=Raphidocelis subcapitata TaxID=307507 RepID=A0A2V0NKH8_9CHLO|nr:hypothetical protein Rsub_00546 [Raphidocelis subcapitata]|eukprot:GBF87834.1 hypothetical protein Rsub_00546 [Raphidocelis subcapitata]